MQNENNKQGLSPIELELQEYKLTERVQEKILSRATFVFAVFIAGLTLLGFFGGSYLIDHTARQVEQEVRKKMEKDAEILTKRLQESLADLKLSTTEILRESENAREQFKKLKDSYKELEQLNSRYSSLYSKVEDLRDKVEQTSTKVASTKKDTENLKEEVFKSLTGVPSILTFHDSVRDDGVMEVVLKGTHLGDSPKNVRIYFELRTFGFPFVEGIIDEKDIRRFNNNEIVFEFNIKEALLPLGKWGEQALKKIVLSIRIYWLDQGTEFVYEKPMMPPVIF